MKNSKRALDGGSLCECGHSAFAHFMLRDECDHTACRCLRFKKCKMTSVEEPEDGAFCNSDCPDDMSFYQLQCQVKEWVKDAFPNHSKRASWMPLMGAVEELGELAHAYLKMNQGIRGTKEEHIKDAEDAVADVIIFLADFCNEMDFDLQGIVEETWEEVKKRNFNKDQRNG